MRRLDYSNMGFRLPKGSASAATLHRIADTLSETWMKEYTGEFPGAEIVSIRLETFDYLFDLTAERNLAAYGIMVGRNTAIRNHARMAGHPKSEGRDYDRGHMIPHSGHGGTDINLFSQLHRVNIGPFRQLEKAAVASPGSLYFVRMLYDDAAAQRPAFVEQGLLAPGSALIVKAFPN